MITRLIQEFKCDGKYCLTKARIPTGSLAYGVDYEKQLRELEKRGWTTVGLKQFCKNCVRFGNHLGVK